MTEHATKVGEEVDTHVIAAPTDAKQHKKMTKPKGSTGVVLTRAMKVKAVRKVRMQYAARFMEVAERMKHVGEELVALERNMLADAVQATDGDEALVTQLCIEYSPAGSIEQQVDNDLGPIEYPGFEDVVTLSECIMDHCQELLETGTDMENPPKLPYELEDDDDLTQTDTEEDEEADEEDEPV
jgi:hypothetical protein